MKSTVGWFRFGHIFYKTKILCNVGILYMSGPFFLCDKKFGFGVEWLVGAGHDLCFTGVLFGKKADSIELNECGALFLFC